MSVNPELPIRSWLFAPGNEPRKVAKVAAFGADAVILDLEDAVPDRDKVATRPLVKKAISEVKGAVVAVRVNGFHTDLTAGDVEGVLTPGLDVVVLPKTQTRADVLRLDEILARAETGAGLPAGSVRVMPLVETAQAVGNAAEIAAASPRVLTLAFGSGDFTRDLELLSVRWSIEGSELFYARSKLVVDARSAGRARPLDGPYLSVRDSQGFAEDCRTGRRIGFQGKICIHPSQVAPCNRIYAPDGDEVVFCRKVVAEFAAAEARGSASITVDGVFVDYPIAEKARRIIRVAEALAAKDADQPLEG